MAELHVQKKRNQLWLLWVIIVLLALAVIYYLLVQNNVLPDTFDLKHISAFVPGADESLIV